MNHLKLQKLRTAIKQDVNQQQANCLQQLTNAKSIDDVLDNHQLTRYLTNTTKKVDYFSSVEDMKKYLNSRIVKHFDKIIKSEITKFDAVLSSGSLEDAVITVTWTKSKTWGANPRAVIKYTYLDIDGSRRSGFYESSSIGGCGYDKLSTAVSIVLNSVKPIKRSLYILKNKQITKKNSDIFGYGSGYGILPSIEGGVGVSCYPDIFSKIGYNFDTIASGKMFDVFQITKKNKI